VALPAKFLSVNEGGNQKTSEATSWNLTCEASSSEEEDNNDDFQEEVSWIHHQREESAIDGDSGFSERAAAGCGGEFMVPNTFDNQDASEKFPLLSIYPAEHNTIVVPEDHISQPWASLFRYDAFNAVQSACFNVAACSDENLIVSAPTGCGKTVLFEFSILRLL
jgi:hypothetical protein